MQGPLDAGERVTAFRRVGDCVGELPLHSPVADGEALGPLVEFLKTTEVGSRAGAREREREWGRRNDHAGEDLLDD